MAPRPTAAIMPGPTPGTSPVGPAAITPHATAQAIPAIQAGVIAEAAAMGRAAVAMAAVEAIDDSRCEGAAF